MNAKTPLMWGAFLAALAVALGAFGAHGLKSLVDANTVTTFETGVRYHFYHAFALLITGLIWEKHPTEASNWQLSTRFFLFGVLLFSGSLYGMTFGKVLGTSLGWLGPITPLGGLAFILGWVWLGKTLSGIKGKG